MTTEEAFRQWWRESYGVPPGTHAVMTHVAWAEHLMGQPPLPPAELVAEWSAAASDDGNAALSQADERIAAMAIQWAWGNMLPADYTRCMGLTPECPMRQRCARHCDIPDDREISWVRNLNPAEDAECLYYIPFQR